MRANGDVLLIGLELLNPEDVDYPPGFANGFIAFVRSLAGREMRSPDLIAEYEEWAGSGGHPVLRDRGLYYDAFHLLELTGTVRIDREFDTILVVPLPKQVP